MDLAEFSAAETLLVRSPSPYGYARAYALGMMLSISSNGSQLSKPPVLRNRGAFDRFTRGLAAAREAALPVKLNLIVSDDNAHELDGMRALAEQYGYPHQTYANMSPTIAGGSEPLPTQAADFLRQRKPFGGCNAGHTFFHADPFGVASICKVGRDPNIRLIEEGVEGLRRLGKIADSLMLRTGGCSGCSLSGTCWT
ncbi:MULTISPECIES: hypothetical protein [Streptomyces]|uniref:hypothetical protein n=1 Tax=Streptomyces TaxID=1883 RepID=UPI001E29D97D|nr:MULTISPECIES: hypothetical protein [Streptomyces]MCZ4102504.1 hypothetical protein [Streptomyces sp. H39-C1]